MRQKVFVESPSSWINNIDGHKSGIILPPFILLRNLRVKLLLNLHFGYKLFIQTLYNVRFPFMCVKAYNIPANGLHVDFLVLQLYRFLVKYQISVR